MYKNTGNSKGEPGHVSEKSCYRDFDQVSAAWTRLFICLYDDRSDRDKA